MAQPLVAMENLETRSKRSSFTEKEDFILKRISYKKALFKFDDYTTELVDNINALASRSSIVLGLSQTSASARTCSAPR